MIETTHQTNASQSYTLASRSKSRPTNQNLPKSMPAPMHARQKQCSKLKGKLTENKEHQPLTSGIKHWGLSGYASVLPRIKFSVTRQESSPQSPTFHTADRCSQF
jgi:hypothetical protein